MSIEIKISDPYRTDTHELRAVASFLNAIADGKPSAHAVIAHSDDPSTGVDPAVIFAQSGNVGARSIAGAGQPSTVHAATLGISTAATDGPLIPVPPNANAAATVAVPAPGTNPVPAGSLDSKGLPWDGRIHSSSKELNKDGSWRARRGVDPATVLAVEAELRGVVNHNPFAQFKTAEELGMTAAPLVPQVPQVPQVPNVPPVPTSPDASQAASVGANPASAAPAMTFPQLVPKVTMAMANGSLADAKLREVLAAFGLATLPALGLQPALVQSVHDLLFGMAA